MNFIQRLQEASDETKRKLLAKSANSKLAELVGIIVVESAARRSPVLVLTSIRLERKFGDKHELFDLLDFLQELNLIKYMNDVFFVEIS